MFTRRLFPGEQRPGYELLGILLLLQIATQSYLSLSTPTTPSTDSTTALLSRILTPNVSKGDTQPRRNPSGDGPAPSPAMQSDSTPHVIDLADPAALPYIFSGSRRCPLCLDPMKDPTAAECGHLFCWTCILRWTGEAIGQGECPICRGKCGREGLLRLAG